MRGVYIYNILVKKTTILFDLDGTLIDSTDSILDGFKTSFLKHNCNYPGDEKIKQFIGYPLDIMFKNLGVDELRIDSFVEKYKEKYTTIYLDSTTLLPNVKEALEIAKSIADIGVVTTKTSKNSKVLLEKLGILKYFEVIIGRDDVENPKPHSEPILKALNFLKKDNKNAYMIGDTKLDAISAINSNITPICLTCGYGKKEELIKYTKFIFDHPLEAVLFISKA